MSKFLKYFLYALLAISTVVIVLFYVQSSTGDFALSNLAEQLKTTSMVDGVMYWAYILVGLSILSLIALSIMGMIENPKTLKRTGITLLLAVVLCVISYFLASGDPVQANLEIAPTETALKLTDTGLIITYILFAATILTIIGGGIYNAIKNR